MFCVFRKSDGLPQGGTRYAPCHADVDGYDRDTNTLIPGTQIIVELNREDFPDAETERWDATLQQVRPVTDMEITSRQREQYRELRAKAYPPMTDYLDAIVKGDEAQRQRYIADCLAVKARYPKP